MWLLGKEHAACPPIPVATAAPSPIAALPDGHACQASVMPVYPAPCWDAFMSCGHACQASVLQAYPASCWDAFLSYGHAWQELCCPVHAPVTPSKLCLLVLVSVSGLTCIALSCKLGGEDNRPQGYGPALPPFMVPQANRGHNLSGPNLNIEKLFSSLRGQSPSMMLCGSWLPR